MSAPYSKSLVKYKHTGLGFWSSNLQYLYSTKSSFLFRKFLMTSLHVIRSLGSRPIQNPGYAMLAGLPNVAYLGKKNAFQLRSTGSVEQVRLIWFVRWFWDCWFGFAFEDLRDASQWGRTLLNNLWAVWLDCFIKLCCWSWVLLVAIRLLDVWCHRLEQWLRHQLRQNLNIWFWKKTIIKKKLIS